MGRFYFHIRGPAGLEPDELGLELGSADQAYLEAYRAIPRLAADLLARGRDPMQSAFEISDDQGRLVVEVPFGEALGWPPGARPGSGRAGVPPRSRAASASAAQSLYRAAFEGSPSAYLILTPELRVIGANDAYLAATETSREQLVDRNLFDVFPENPDGTANGVRNLTASFERALRFAMRDVLPRQRYDIRGRDGAWLTRYWTPTNWPIFDENGSAIALVQHVVAAT